MRALVANPEIGTVKCANPLAFEPRYPRVSVLNDKGEMVQEE